MSLSRIGIQVCDLVSASSSGDQVAIVEAEQVRIEADHSVNRSRLDIGGDSVGLILPNQLRNRSRRDHDLKGGDTPTTLSSYRALEK